MEDLPSHLGSLVGRPDSHVTIGGTRPLSSFSLTDRVCRQSSMG